MSRTKIEWADVVWNLVTGCTKVGAGCKHCYAARMWPRLASMTEKYRGRDFGDVGLHYSVLDDPFRWKKPRTVFVNSMGDLFHKDVPDEFIHAVFAVMRTADWHTYVVLTKRPRRMLRFAENGGILPFQSNIYFGVSCSTQDETDHDASIICSADFPKKIVSLEPLLGPVDISKYLRYGPPTYPSKNAYRRPPLSGVIVGGETGPGARPTDPDWVRSLRDQCAAAGTPFFFKQWGEWLPRSQGAVTAGHLPWGCLLQDGTFVEGATTWNGRQEDGPDRESSVVRVGKRRAGRLLDGRTHDALPWGGGK